MKNTPFDDVADEAMSKPTTVAYESTPGCFVMICATWSANSCDRCCEAASGSVP